MNFDEVIEHHLLDHPLFKVMSFHGHTLYFTRHVLMMMIAAILVLVLGISSAHQAESVPTGWRNAMEAMVVFFRDQVVGPNLGEYTNRYLSYFVSLFCFILFCNLLGLVPWGASATANIAVTATLALLTLLMVVSTGIWHHGVIQFIKSFVPAGLPWYMAPVIFPIEVLSVFTKSFALCIRLFANMLAGHIAILAFMSLIFLFHSLGIAIVTSVVLVALSLLELLVAFLQAYIFTMLTAVIVGGAVNPQH